VPTRAAGCPKKFRFASSTSSHLREVKCIQKIVTGAQVTNRKQSQSFGHARTILLITLYLCVVAALPARATPIKPTAKQLLRQAQQPVMPYVPAQVGWQDAATDRRDTGEGATVVGRFNTSEILRDAEAARARRAILLSIGRPDPRVLLAFTAIILLLRKMRTVRGSAAVPAPVQAPSH
jgi:hypothetical protein